MNLKLITYVIYLCIFTAITYAFSYVEYDYIKDVQLVNKTNGLTYLEQPAISRLMDHSLTLLQYGGLDGQDSTHFFNLTIQGFFFNLSITLKHQLISDIAQTEIGYNNYFQVKNYFNHEKTAAMLTFSQKIPLLPIYYGLNIKGYQQKLLTSSMQGFGYDAGVIIKVNDFIVGLSYNDINNSSYDWSTGKSDYIKENFSYQFAQKLSFGYISYVGSDNFTDYLKFGINAFDMLGIESKFLLDETVNLSLACSLDLGSIEVGIRKDFNDIYGDNSQFFMTMKL
jgi:hypothetical protein